VAFSLARTEQTVDIDFAHAAITTMPEDFLPLVQYRGNAGASYRHATQAEYQIDFLCPKHSDSDGWTSSISGSES
jgi:hypothetical protein